MANWCRLVILICFVLLCGIVNAESIETAENENLDAKEQEDVNVDEAKLEYTKGSACKYCEYCRFCKLCDKECPCEKTASKPNCHMCKYCKFCPVCKICDTICQPGGIVDRMSAAVINALPTHNPEEIEKDLDTVKEYISRDEL